VKAGTAAEIQTLSLCCDERALNVTSPARSPLEQAQAAEVWRMLDVLPPRERYVLEQYFQQDRALKSIAVDLGVNESRVSQIKTRAVKRIRESLSRTTI
jgi:RNA polymerase sigma factor for flagellar operon FliA